MLTVTMIVAMTMTITMITMITRMIMKTNNDFYPLLVKAGIGCTCFLHKLFSLILFFFPPDNGHDYDKG